MAQTIKVVNAIIREQGESPVSIHLELAREMSKSFQERADLENAMKENNADNERLMRDLHERFPGRNISGQDLVKYRLWKEQDGRCAYSLQPLELQSVITVSGYAEVDHIVPYSISFDDCRTNKVLVLAAEKSSKGQPPAAAISAGYKAGQLYRLHKKQRKELPQTPKSAERKP